MVDVFPLEIWLHIFKQTDVGDLFKKREVCHGFKKIIDDNLKHFYLNFSSLYPSLFPFKSRVYVHDFIIGQTKIFINSLSRYKDCPTTFIQALISENISLKQAKRILYLYKNHNFNWWYGLQTIDMNNHQLNQTYKLINIGLTCGYALRLSKQSIYTDEQFNIFKDLFSNGISEYYSDKIALTFTQNQLDRFYYFLKYTDVWWVHAIWIIQSESI